MRTILLASLLAAAAPVAVHAHQAPPPAAASKPVPKETLLKPAADAVHYVVVSDAGKYGDMWRWTLADGRLAFRHSQSLRGWISETDQVVKLGASGLPEWIESRGITPSGDAAETCTFANGKATRKSTADSGSSAAGYSGRPK